MSTVPRLIAIDGPAGAGKSAVAQLVANGLRARDVPTVLCAGTPEPERAPVLSRLLDLEEDIRRQGLAPQARVGLACARLSQLVSEVIRPALQAGQTVVVDGSPLGEVASACFVDGLPRDACEAALRQALDGCLFDRIVVLDVDPKTAQIRKILEAVASHRFGCVPGDWGDTATASERRRMGFLQLAMEGQHALIRTERVTAETCANTIVQWLGGEPLVNAPGDDVPYWRVPDSWGLGPALASMPTNMALYFSRGLMFSRALRREAMSETADLVAWGLDRQDPLREQLALISPEFALRGLVGRPLSPRDLRVRTLDRAPAAVAWSLSFLACERSDALRDQIAAVDPGAVLGSLIGRDDPAAWAIRKRLWDRGDSSHRAWSLMRCHSELANRYRETLLHGSPIEGVASLRGAEPEHADPWLWRYSEVVPRLVLRSLTGRDDASSYRLREALYEVGADVIHSLRGLTDPISWRLRERAVNRWPAAVVRSLMGVPDSTRRTSLATASQHTGLGDVHVLRGMQELDEYRRWPSWARSVRDRGFG